MLIRMDTDSIRAMAFRLRQTADLMEGRMAVIRSTAKSTQWQSNARDEFIMHLESLNVSTNQSIIVMRMMAQAAEQKAAQWEAIGNVFNGPFQFLSGIWRDILNRLGSLWGGIGRAINNIRLPSIPWWVYPPIMAPVISGGIRNLVPPWDFKKPDWWPFNPKDKNYISGGGIGGGGGRSWGDELHNDYLDKTTPPNTENLNQLRIETIDHNRNAPIDDCVKFVKAQRDDVPSNTFNNEEGIYTGNYKGKTGTLHDGTEYGQEPRLGAIMGESPSSTNGIPFGHASYVTEVEYDSTGKVIRYKIAEGAWDGGYNEEVFSWDNELNLFTNQSKKRSPDVFIY